VPPRVGEGRYPEAGESSPFFPEVLIASAVMAEEVDLHLDCGTLQLDE
jgi:hypothetical protein